MPDEKPDSKSRAAGRLDQVHNHLSPAKPAGASASPARRRRKQPRGDDELPADYSDIRGQIATLKRKAATPDASNRGYQRQKKAGKMWVRERVEAFVDPGTFREVGSVSGTVTWRTVGEEREEPVEFVPSNNVQGFGRLGGRIILFTADDYSIRAGHADGSLAAKTVRGESAVGELADGGIAIHGAAERIAEVADD
jgi:acetyl-CoA carboxylase carboxyltransferase component